MSSTYLASYAGYYGTLGAAWLALYGWKLWDNRPAARRRREAERKAQDERFREVLRKRFGTGDGHDEH